MREKSRLADLPGTVLSLRFNQDGCRLYTGTHAGRVEVPPRHLRRSLVALEAEQRAAWRQRLRHPQRRIAAKAAHLQDSDLVWSGPIEDGDRRATAPLAGEGVPPSDALQCLLTALARRQELA